MLNFIYFHHNDTLRARYFQHTQSSRYEDDDEDEDDGHLVVDERARAYSKNNSLLLIYSALNSFLR